MYIIVCITVDFVVKETPVKKQVQNYRRFKLQRLRCIRSFLVSHYAVIQDFLLPFTVLSTKGPNSVPPFNIPVLRHAV